MIGGCLVAAPVSSIAASCRVTMPGRLSLLIVEGPEGGAPADAQDFLAGLRASVRSVKAVFDGSGQAGHAAGLSDGRPRAARGGGRGPAWRPCAPRRAARGRR